MVSVPSRPAVRPLVNAALLALALAVTGCALLDQASGEAARGPAPGAITTRISAVQDVDGVHPGLTAPVPSERARALRLIDGILIGPRLGRGGYAREAFGPDWTDETDATWGRNDCRTREDILRRDLKAKTIRPGTGGCVVLDGLLDDPYTGRLIQFSKSRPTEVQIDHVIPLFYAWQLGARDWTDEQRARFANDPLNLLAVDGPANQQKNASGPASWQPPNRAIRCAYAVRIARVAQRYRLPMTRADRTDMRRRCAALPG